jgi:hypothetical protein
VELIRLVYYYFILRTTAGLARKMFPDYMFPVSRVNGRSQNRSAVQRVFCSESERFNSQFQLLLFFVKIKQNEL